MLKSLLLIAVAIGLNSNLIANIQQPPPHSRMLVKKPKPVLDIVCDVQIEIPGLVCASCAIGVKKNLANLFFISPKDIKFDTKKQSVCLELSNFVDGDRKTFLKKYESKIKKAVKDAGYEVKKIKVSQKAFV